MPSGTEIEENFYEIKNNIEEFPLNIFIELTDDEMNE